MSDVNNQYYVKLGAIEEGLKSVSRLYGVIDNKLDKIIDSTAVINDKANKAHARIDEITDPHTGDLPAALAAAEDWLESKKMAKGVFFGLGLSGLLAGTTFGAWASKLGAFLGGEAP